MSELAIRLPWRSARTATRRRVTPALVIGAATLAAFAALGVLSFFWLPAGPNDVNIADRLVGVGAPGHPLGTDRLGQDTLSQIMVGARTSLTVSVVSTIGAAIPGVLIGLFIAGSRRPWQTALTRVADLGVAFPGVLIALVLAAVLGPGEKSAIIAIIIWFVPLLARVTIGPARQILTRDYIEAAFAYGRSRPYVLVRHVLPNIAPLIIVQTSLMFASAIMVEASLSYLGAGAQRPAISWGLMLNEAQPFIQTAPHLMVIPGLAIALAVLGFNLLGDGLRTLLDPRQRSGTADAQEAA